jgi:hypothetical protein
VRLGERDGRMGQPCWGCVTLMGAGGGNQEAAGAAAAAAAAATAASWLDEGSKKSCSEIFFENAPPLPSVFDSTLSVHRRIWIWSGW